MSREDALSVLKALALAVIETVQEFPDGAPEGPMYMSFMAQGLSLHAFQSIVQGCIDAGRLRRSGNLLFPVEVT